MRAALARWNSSAARTACVSAKPESPWRCSSRRNPRPRPSADHSASAPAAPAKPAEPDANHHLVPSPIVGTFYEAGSPGSPPFVKIGDHVEPDTVLCIIESMKLMNEINAEVSGVVVAKLVENGRPVEYGTALFAIATR